MVTASTEMMPELCLLKDVMKSKGIEIDPQWISSAENTYADLRSRSWDPCNVQATRLMIGFLLATLTQVVGRGTVFRYRVNGGENPVSQRKTVMAAWKESWGNRHARPSNPPSELPTVKLNKIAREGAKKLVLVPYLGKEQGLSQLRRQTDRMYRLKPHTGAQ